MESSSIESHSNSRSRSLCAAGTHKKRHEKNKTNKNVHSCRWLYVAHRRDFLSVQFIIQNVAVNLRAAMLVAALRTPNVKEVARKRSCIYYDLTHSHLRAYSRIKVFLSKLCIIGNAIVQFCSLWCWRDLNAQSKQARFGIKNVSFIVTPTWGLCVTCAAGRIFIVLRKLTLRCSHSKQAECIVKGTSGTKHIIYIYGSFFVLTYEQPFCYSRLHRTPFMRYHRSTHIFNAPRISV